MAERAKRGTPVVSTVYDVAEAAGVSVSTASRVLSNSSYYVSAELRDRVLHAARRLNYAPNVLAQTFRKQMTRDIGVIVPSINNPFFPEVIGGIEDSAYHRGYSVYLCSTSRDRRREREYFEGLINKRVRGIIIASPIPGLRRLLDGPGRRIEVIAVDEEVGDATLGSVTCHHEHASYAVTKHLADLGHRQIAFVSTPLNKQNRRSCHLGFRRAMSDAGIEVQEELVKVAEHEEEVEGGFEESVGHELALKLLQASRRPTAIVAGNDMVAIGVLSAAYRCNVRVPTDLSVVGVDGINLTKLVYPVLTTAFLPKYQMGRIAAESLIAALEGSADRRRTDIVLEPQLLIRDSTAKPPYAAQEFRTRIPGAVAPDPRRKGEADED